MKKINKCLTVPQLLADYLRDNPNNEWDQFRGNDLDGLYEVQKNLRSDQRGICAYCEIDLLDDVTKGKSDFRVEHFYPKKPHMPAPDRTNYSLLWSNLLASCHGGGEKYVCDPTRFTNPDKSCDQPKDNHNWVDDILNPTSDIPVFPLIFEFNEKGEMFVATNCPSELVSKAKESIDRLRLSPESTIKIPNPRLIKFRKEVLDELNQILRDIQDSEGKTLEQSKQELAAAMFSGDLTKPWPAFFSCIRWYLDKAAEDQLQSIGYNG